MKLNPLCPKCTILHNILGRSPPRAKDRIPHAVAPGIRFIPHKLKKSTLSYLLIPNCQKCGQPMSFDQEEKRWYCFTDNLPFIKNEQASKSSPKPKPDWGRILATLLCILPSSNPSFFLSAYDRQRLKGLNCSHCKSIDTEVVNRTLRLRNRRFDTIFEYRCLSCGAAWQRRWERGALPTGSAMKD